VTSLIDRREIEKLLVVNGALRAGLVDALAAPGSHEPADVAEMAGTDLRATLIMLEALVDLGVADRTAETDGPPRYRLTELGRRHLVDAGPDLERSSLLHQANKARGWLELPYVLENGRPPARERRGHRDTRSFALTMAEGDPAIMDEVIDWCVEYLKRTRAGTVGEVSSRDRRLTMLDVGGAVGHLARRFAARGFAATLLDRPEIIPIAEEYLGESSGVQVVGGDFLEELPPGPFDLVFLGNVYHIYGPRTNLALTRRAFASLAHGGAIAIRDYVLGRSPRAPLFAVNMLQATERGGVWTEECFRGWLERSGFARIEVIDLHMVPNQLILGSRP
jgi:3-hydroxy-5-methyl-1-naphthoate 3-O-methyltransferase